MFENLPKQGEQGPFKSGENKKLFYDTLPKEFQRKEAVEMAINFNIKERTVDNFLKACLGKYLIKSDTGLYKKIQ